MICEAEREGAGGIISIGQRVNNNKTNNEEKLRIQSRASSSETG